MFLNKLDFFFKKIVGQKKIMSWQQYPWQIYKWQKYPWQQFEGQQYPWQKYKWQEHPWQQFPWQKHPWQTFEGQQRPWQQQQQQLHFAQDVENSKMKTNMKSSTFNNENQQKPINLKITQGVSGMINIQQKPINVQEISPCVNGITNVLNANNKLPENANINKQQIIHKEENDTIETITQLCSQIDELTKKTENKNDIHQNVTIKNDCAICLNENVNIVFIPCGHAASCDKCAALLTICCVCRAPITTYQKVFF